MLHDAWKLRISDIIHCGTYEAPRGRPTYEQLDQCLAIEDSRFNLIDLPARNLNMRLAVAEWLWMTFGHSDVESIAQYAKVMRQFSDDGMFLAGAYGPHLRAQWHQIVEKLRTDPSSRQAVIEIPRPRRETKDEPCTLSLQFLSRNKHLHLIVTMRSSDTWTGLPYDVFNFTQLQNMMAGELELRRGWFSLHAGSSHLYQDDFAAAEAMLVDPRGQTVQTPDLPGLPPAWLEDVLLKRHDAEILKITRRWDDQDLRWLPYAQVLLTSTRDAARDLLITSFAHLCIA